MGVHPSTYEIGFRWLKAFEYPSAPKSMVLTTKHFSEITLYKNLA